MLKIALTGGIATGKSYVLERFRRHGIPCLDADELAHGVTAAGTEATAAIAVRFGSDMLAPDGAVDRSKLGPLVFADASARRELEAIVHPAVYRAITAGLRAFELVDDSPFAIVDVPLLFETGAEEKFDLVVVTHCRPETQIARLRERGLSEEAARQRIDAQWPADKKIAVADYLISTDGTFAETDQRVDEICRQLASST